MLAHRIRYHCNYAMGKYKVQGTRCVCVCVCVCVALLVIMRINNEHLMYVLDCSCIDIYVSTVVPPITISIWSQRLRPALTVRTRAHAFP